MGPAMINHILTVRIFEHYAKNNWNIHVHMCLSTKKWLDTEKYTFIFLLFLFLGLFDVTIIELMLACSGGLTTEIIIATVSKNKILMYRAKKYFLNCWTN